MYKGKVIRGDSLDPNYKVKFSYSCDAYEIIDGEAIFTRQSPFPIVIFDDHTDYIIEKYAIDDNVLKTLRLEIGKSVFDYIYSTRT